MDITVFDLQIHFHNHENELKIKINNIINKHYNISLSLMIKYRRKPITIFFGFLVFIKIALKSRFPYPKVSLILNCP